MISLICGNTLSELGPGFEVSGSVQLGLDEGIVLAEVEVEELPNGEEEAYAAMALFVGYYRSIIAQVAMRKSCKARSLRYRPQWCRSAGCAMKVERWRLI
jgi:hypothetical protein